MRISAVSNFQIPSMRKEAKIRNNFTPNLYFGSGDSFRRESVIDREIRILNEDIENYLDPFKDKYKEKYKLIGLIGYDSQEKLKLAKNFEQELFQKRFNLTNHPVFKKTEKVTKLYEQYIQNVKEFENSAKLIENNQLISTPELKRIIQKQRPKIYRDREEFEKIKPLYEAYNNTLMQINDDLDKINSQRDPQFTKRINELDEQNKEAIFFMLAYGYADLPRIYADADNLRKEAQNPKTNLYDLMQRIEKINYDIQSLKNRIINTEENDTDLNRYIEKYKDYKTTNLTQEEISEAYTKLLQETDETINKHTEQLDNYLATHTLKLSPRIVDRTLKAQKKINKELNLLIWKEKEKKYRQSIDEFNSKYDN